MEKRNSFPQHLGKAWVEEEKNKEAFYQFLAERQGNAEFAVASADRNYRAGQFEEQDSFIAAGELSAQRKNLISIDKENKELYDHPYFAHIHLVQQEASKPMHIFLSDNEWLDHPMLISGDASKILAPFKYDENHPMLGVLRQWYANPSLTPVSYQVNQTKQTLSPKLLRNTEISKRELINVTPLLPQDGTAAESINVDDLLAQRLDENRHNVEMRNIISTLQKKQLEIISENSNVHFVVQGCAGSGKTQCLVHRLFFLRESLAKHGWEKVLLITPTQLFRNYSSALMRRYRLTDVSNCSLTAFYRDILSAFDPRFRQRQYLFEMSEEYLPDEYLQQVYSDRKIHEIEHEIQSAINSHTIEAGRLVGYDVSQDSHISIQTIQQILVLLSEAIENYDQNEKEFSLNPEYVERCSQLESLTKELRKEQNSHEKLLQTASALQAQENTYLSLQQELESAKGELLNWDAAHKQSSIKAELERKTWSNKIEAVSDENALAALLPHYAATLAYIYSKQTVEQIDSKENSYRDLLEKLWQESEQKLNAFLGKKTEAAFVRQLDKQKKENEERMRDCEDTIALIELYVDEHTRWLQNYLGEKALNHDRQYREALEKSKYYLSRMESSVFEQEVWNALLPLKKENHIVTTQSETLKDGQSKHTRILHKSDLLFYLKIYLALHSIDKLPAYQLICIDEGQDLHTADYTMIHSLYPKAVLNVFGDTEQVLHEACGVRNWTQDTGISKIFRIDRNYRTAPAIVEFCNHKFGSTMKWCGVIHKDEKPIVLRSPEELVNTLNQTDLAVIVKNKAAFEMLRQQVGKHYTQLTYVDTTAESVPKDKIPCYSVFAAKGLEFPHVLVYANAMSKNQRIVACTRATAQLFYY